MQISFGTLNPGPGKAYCVYNCFGIRNLNNVEMLECTCFDKICLVSCLIQLAQSCQITLHQQIILTSKYQASLV